MYVFLFPIGYCLTSPLNEQKSYKNNHTRLEVVVDDGRVNLVEVLESVDNLHDNRAAFLLSHQLILLQVEVQIVAFTVLQYCAEPNGEQGKRTVILPRDQKNRSHPRFHSRVCVE